MLNPILKKIGNDKLFIICFCLIIFIVISFSYLFTNEDATVYFLDVGQGDSEFITFSNGVDILIDGGPINNKVIRELSRIMPFTDRYIDLVVMTHPEVDHFGGLIDVFKRYKVGAFIYNGQKGTSLALADLEDTIKKDNPKKIILKPGDKIYYQDSKFEVTGNSIKSINNSNDNSLVLKATLEGIKILFTGDISEKVEVQIKDEIGDIDILKVPHHGSKYSSSIQFLNTIHPKIAVIEVGNNSYGHPATETLKRLEDIKAHVFRTDEQGTMKIILDGNVDNLIKFSTSR